MKKQPAGARPAGREGSEGELQRVSSGLLISPCRAGRDPLVAQAVDNVAELIPEGLSPRSPSLGGYGPISDLGVLSGGRPIAVLAPYTISKGARRDCLSWLRYRHRQIKFVDCRERYMNGAGWRQRWPRERRWYGAGIVLTAGEVPPDWIFSVTPEQYVAAVNSPDLVGVHTIGAGTYQSIGELLDESKPVGWVARDICRGMPQSTFAIVPLAALGEEMSLGRFVRLIPCDNAVPFRPLRVPIAGPAGAA